MTCTTAREKIYVKDEWDDVQNTIDVTLVKDDDKQIDARKRVDLF